MNVLRLLPVILVAGLTVAAAAKSGGSSLEFNTNRMGGDYTDIELPMSAGPDVCQKACNKDAKCLAFTYVKAGVQGDNPRCWLKDSVPEASPDENCVSGLRAGAGEPRMSLEYNINRVGSDFRDLDLAVDAGPEICEKACRDDHQCRAFTYVKTGVQADNPRCWLKDDVPEPTPDENCISGVK